MENIQKKTPIISSSSFVLILLFCLLPFVSVRCSDQKIAEVTGVELLTGNYSVSEKSKEEKQEKNPFMVLVFLSAIAGIIFSIVFKNKGKEYKISVISSAAIISVSLLLMQLYISYDIKSQSGGQKDEFSAELASMITVNYEIGYWLCLLLPLALIVFMLLINPRKLQE